MEGVTTPTVSMKLNPAIGMGERAEREKITSFGEIRKARAKEMILDVYPHMKEADVRKVQISSCEDGKVHANRGRGQADAVLTGVHEEYR